jgi:hypothetical protein
MKIMKFGIWTIEIDVSKTKRFYDNYHLITEDCQCDYCANYVLACDKFPLEIKELFNSLGIDPRKEGEVSHYLENQDKTHFYGAFYHIAGKIIEGPTTENSELLSPNFFENTKVDICFSEELTLVPEGFPTPTIQFEIHMNFPWFVTFRGES